MQTIQAAHILSIRTGLAAEALSVSAVLNGQVFLIEDDVAIDIRDGHLSGGNQIEVVHFSVIHLTFLVGQLACAIARCSVNYRRRHYLRVATLAGFVEEEVNECALQTSTFTDVDGETGTRNLHSEVKVDEVVFLGQLPMGKGIVNTQLGIHVPIAHSVLLRALLQVALHDAVVLGSMAFRHLVIRNVRNLAKQGCEFLLGAIHKFLQVLVLLLEVGYLQLYLFGLVALALLHERTNLSSQLLGLLFGLIEFALCFTALAIYCQYILYRFARTIEVLFLKAANHPFCFLIDEFEC